MTSRSADCGFTLVEVLVALTILALIMLATVSALRTLGNTQGAIERTTQRVDEIRTVSSFLRDAMETAVVSGNGSLLSLGGAGGNETMYFRFEGDFLEWKTVVLFGENFGGTYIVRVGRESDTLVLRWQAASGQDRPKGWTGTPSRVLVHDLEEFSVSVKESFGSAWVGGWGKSNPPALVRLQVKTAGRYWPDLIMPALR